MRYPRVKHIGGGGNAWEFSLDKEDHMVRVSVGVAIISVLMAACAPGQSRELASLREEVTQLRAVAGPPPASLDRLYPPAAPGPLLLMRMLGLSEALTGVAVDAFERDIENARAGLERFRTEYASVAGLVPEWQGAYPTEPVDALATALESGDPARIGAGFEAVGAVCHECHVANMPMVQYRYRWSDFDRITLSDPSSGRGLSFRQLMQELEMAFVGVGTDLRQQQVMNAREQFATFQARFDLLTAACAYCHASERKYFVDADIRQLIQRLGATLRNDAPDTDLVMQLGRQIGEESCARCHLVHGPAALTRERWAGP